MKFMVCPQCGIAHFYIKNEIGDRVNIKVSRELEIVFVDQSIRQNNLELDTIYCLGCSWKGKKTELKRFLL